MFAEAEDRLRIYALRDDERLYAALPMSLGATPTRRTEPRRRPDPSPIRGIGAGREKTEPFSHRDDSSRFVIVAI